MIESKASDTLLDKPVKFRIGKKNFKIKPLKLGTIIAIGKQTSLFGQIDNIEAVPAMLNASGNLKPMAKVIALAVLNSRIKNAFASLYAQYFLYKLTPNELYQVAMYIVRQMKVDDFFFTMTLMKGANVLKSNEAEKQSGEPLPESQKPSGTATTKSSGK